MGLIALLTSGIAIAEVPAAIDGTKLISAEDLIDLVESEENFVIIDSRTGNDREQGYIEGSIGLPDTETDEAALAKHIASKNTPVCFYCNGVDCGRSVKAAKMAVSFGYTKIYWFRGGWGEWVEKGLPVAK